MLVFIAVFAIQASVLTNRLKVMPHLSTSHQIIIDYLSTQAFKSLGNPEKFDRLVLFVVMGLGSGMALAKAISMKPKKEKK